MATVLILALKVQYIYYKLIIKLIRYRESDQKTKLKYKQGPNFFHFQ